ncbi:MAG: ATP-binding cassette domain-containing protein [Acetobacter aceti]|uniref:ABC transporter ATP-binding protein n=1 Tax=Acetobacter aceti TaxID=435 RepID=A0A1U9KDK8_ACEAC|nr:ATP-binding cassette domain-containing protein [Acetobacter aceti]AQS83819.1 ABC transporter ATP-binding protein [Acetobacter aceti]
MQHPVLACRQVSRLYGARASEFIKDGHITTDNVQTLQEAGITPAIFNVDLDIERGKTFVIMGLSGSGKSTLLRCLAGLTPPSAGQILFESKDLFGFSEADLIQIHRHQMGMVFQHFALLPHLTVLGNVAFPLEIQGRPRAEREEIARQMIRLVGLEGREHRFPAQLSGGQQQRVGIARSLAGDPDVWFLDEPFSALDPLIRREMQAEVIRLQGMLKKTIVFITHDFEEAVRVADRIAIMKDGLVEQIGTAEELLVSPATDYVRAFTRDAPRAHILTARSIMTTPPPAGPFGGEVSATDRVISFARQLDASSLPLAVIEDNEIIGAIDRAMLLDILIGPNAQAVGA